MKVVIFAGGQGSRLSEETELKPKPMVEIGDKPILWHIMKNYAHYGYKEFILCLGYKGYMIKEWFNDYFLLNSDATIDLGSNKLEIHNPCSDDWKITLVDTGLNTGTANRLAKVKQYIGNGNFMLTYGDGVTDVDIDELIEFHNNHGKIATVTAVQPEGRFGSMQIDNECSVINFAEKIDNKNSWINGGFFVLRPEVFNYLPEENVMWEKEPLERLSQDGQLVAYKHRGFWKAMDTLRDKLYLEKLWLDGNPPWKLW